MYRTTDAWSAVPTVMVYITLILIGSQLVINIMLAVITGSLDDVESDRNEDSSEHDVKSSKTKLMTESQSQLIAHMNIRWLVGTRGYEKFMLSIIVINTIVLSCDHYGISEGFLDVLEVTNVVTTVVFCVDVLLCNLAVGLLTYWR